MGRHREPTAKHELTGAFKKNPSRGRDRANEPKPTGVLGEPPAHFTASQAAVWKELATLAPPGVLTNSDRWVVEVACQLMEKSRREGDPDCSGCRGKGAFFDKDGKWLAECRRCEGLSVGEKSQLVKCLSLMGLSPVDRSKVAVPKREESDEFSEFVN